MSFVPVPHSADAPALSPVRLDWDLGPLEPAVRRKGRAVAWPRVGVTWHGLVGHVALGALSVFCLLPIVWMYVASFRSPSDVLSSGILPAHASIESYRSAVASLPVVHLLLNTLAMAVGVALGQLLTGLLAAYAFARWRFRGEKVLFLLVVATWLVPFQVTMLPNYVLLSRLGLLNSIAGVIVPQLSSAFAVLLLRQHLKSFPAELFDAAEMDGQSAFATLWTVVVPNIGPSLAALAILLFVSSWNEYFWPLLVFHTPVSVVQLAIQGFLSSDSMNYGALMAASGLACLPVFVIYVVLQRRIVDAFVRSGLR